MLQSADNSVRADHHDLFVITKGHLAIIVREIIGAEGSIGHAGKGAVGMVEAAADRNRPARRGVIIGWLPDKQLLRVILGMGIEDLKKNGEF